MIIYYTNLVQIHEYIKELFFSKDWIQSLHGNIEVIQGHPLN